MTPWPEQPLLKRERNNAQSSLRTTKRELKEKIDTAVSMMMCLLALTILKEGQMQISNNRILIDQVSRNKIAVGYRP